MARVVTGDRRRGAIDPLKHSQPLGGALVFLGLSRSMPLLHGSQGCTAFAKALLTRHFGEPIPLQTTAVTEVTAVLGAGELLTAGLDTIQAKQRPDVIGVLTTGLTEVSGEDVDGELRAYLAGSGPDAPLIVLVSTPDFRGGLSDGWAAALEALVRAVPLDPQGGSGSTVPSGPAYAPCPPYPAAGNAAAGNAASGTGRRFGGGTHGEPVGVLVGPSLTAVDLDELATLIRGFGLDPLIVPDLSGSLDGHLADNWSPLTTGGTTVAELRRLGAAQAIVAAGSTAAPAGAALAARTGADLLGYPHLSGLRPVDELVAALIERTGAPVPESARRWRARLTDGLLDTHFVLGGARVAIAGEPEQLVATGSLLADAGAEIVAAVSPTPAPVLQTAPWAEVVIGDLSDLEERAAEAGAELVIASSHGRPVADRIGAAHLAVGFPVYDRIGPQLQGTAGYRGSLRLLVDAANRLLDHRVGHGGNGGHGRHGGSDGHGRRGDHRGADERGQAGSRPVPPARPAEPGRPVPAGRPDELVKEATC